MKTRRFKIGRLRFASRAHIAFTGFCAIMAISALAMALFNPYGLLHAGAFIALTVASYKEPV
jgi:hypothetical protein